MRRIIGKTLSLLCVLAGVTSANAQSPDIIGVKLGVPVETDLATIGLGYQKFFIKSQDGVFTVTFLQIVKPNAPDPRVESWTLQTMNGVVTYVNHYVNYQSHKDLPEIGDTISRLNTKYGYSTQDAGGKHFWAWDEEGHQYGNSQNKQIQDCTGAVNGNQRVQFDTTTVTGVPNGDWLHKTCSYAITAFMKNTQLNGRWGMAGDMSVSMMDVRPYVALAIKRQANQPQPAPQKKVEVPM